MPDVNNPAPRHRLAESAKSGLGNHGTHTPSGHRPWLEPRGGRAVHVEVDLDAWRALRAQAAIWHIPVARVLTRLVFSAIDAGIPVEDAIIAVDERATEGRRATTFARVEVLSDDDWARFKAEAIDAGVTVARALGICAEFAVAELRRQTAAQRAAPERSRDHPARTRDGRGFNGHQR